MENFYLEQNEELFSIIDRVKRSRDDDIVLVVPGGLSALRSIINLRILKEEAISLGKKVSITTSDTLIKKLAKQADLRVLDKVEEPSLGEKIEDKEKSWPEQLKEREKFKPGVIHPPVGIEREPGTPKEKKVISDIISPAKEVPETFKPPEEIQPPKEIVEEPTFIEEEKPSFVEPEEEKEEVFYEPDRVEPSFKIFTAKRLLISFIILCLVGGGVFLYFILPNAQVIITPKKEIIHSEAEILADKNVSSIDLDNNAIPGQVFQIEMEDSKKFPTTGEKEVEEKAQGIIIVYNQYSSEPQTLVKTTRFLSENKKLFRLAETAVIPGATIEEGEIIPSTKEVEVIADEAGEAYNIGPSNFTIPGFEGTAKYAAFYGRSIESMTGGAKGKMRVATAEDIEGAIEIVSVELKAKLQEQFSKRIPEELKTLKESQVLEIIETDSTLEADEPGKEFLITVKAKAWGLAFKEDDIFFLIERIIGDKISENKILLSSSIKVNYSDAVLDSKEGILNFSCQIEADAAWKIDEESFKDELAGKNEIEVRKYLSSLSEIESAKVIFWPFWVKKIPSNKDKIKIVIQTD